MNKYYEMIFWMNNYNESLDEQVDRIFLSLKACEEVDYLIPCYLKSSSKQSAPKFELSKKNVKELIITNMNTRTIDLGSRFGFFTSMDDTISCGISFSTGIKSKMFVNTLVITISHTEYKEEQEIEEINNLFLQLIYANKPCYACLTDQVNRNKYGDGKLLNIESGLPNAVLWINYWGKNISENLDLYKKRKRIEGLCDIKELLDGYYIRLQYRPINDSKSDELLNQEKFNQIMCNL